MRLPHVLALSLVFGALFALGHRDHVSAQYRVQETPALNGLGMLLFKDIEFRLDGGYGNTAATSFVTLDKDDPNKVITPNAHTQWYGGIFIDKPIVSDFLEMAYDCELFGQRDWLPRDSWYRDMFFEPIRMIAFYRAGNFRVSGALRDSEFYVGGRFSFDLGRVMRHVSIFQR